MDDPCGIPTGGEWGNEIQPRWMHSVVGRRQHWNCIDRQNRAGRNSYAKRRFSHMVKQRVLVVWWKGGTDTLTFNGLTSAVFDDDDRKIAEMELAEAPTVSLPLVIDATTRERDKRIDAAKPKGKAKEKKAAGDLDLGGAGPGGAK